MNAGTFTCLVFLWLGSCAAWMDERPVLESRDGHLYISSAKDRNITLKTLGSGYVNVNGINLVHVATNARDASEVVERWKSDLMVEMDSKLRRLSEAVEGSSGLLSRISMLELGSSSAVNISKNTERQTGNRPVVNDLVARNRIRNLVVQLRTLTTRVKTLENKLRADNCNSNPCQNGGTCESIYDGFRCLCPSNWEGPVCANDVNECANFAGTDLGCQNGATCTNMPGTYQCLCASGWYGFHCTKKTNDCNIQNSNEICGHGVCVSKPGTPLGYTCLCDQGWESGGTNPACIKDVDECKGNRPSCSVSPLVPCINVPGAFYCGACPAGYTGNGHYCADIDECAVNNGGCSTIPHVPCINTMGSRICGTCPAGYTGDGMSCVFAGACANNGGCHPLATCIESPTSLEYPVGCRCPAGYHGNGIGPRGCLPGSAELEIVTACSSNPCVHGTCSPNGFHDYVCRCNPGFTGKTCATAVQLCNPNPCKNSGTCSVSNAGSETCICTTSFSGPRCETPRQSCGGVLRDPSGTLKFPVDNNVYQPLHSCAWVLLANHSLVLNVTFTAFDLEPSTECMYDFLQIHDGRTAAYHPIGRYCGNNLPNGGNIISSHNALYLWFRSDNSVSHGGFTLEWHAIEPICGEEIHADFGSIKSPGSPGKYPSNRDCYWKVFVNPGRRIQFHFFTMMIQAHPTCEKDYLEIQDGTDGTKLLGKYCNHTIPPALITNENTATLHFHSDGSVQDNGFQITFSSIEGVPGCGGVYTSSEGEIASPGHNSRYQSNMICDWKIQLPQGERIKITWLTFNLESSPSCKFDYVEIFQGDTTEDPLIGRYCGDNLPHSILTETNVILIRFKSDWSISGEGFHLRYETICGGVFTEPTGILKSPYYPNNYPASKTCVYEIIQPPGKSIALTIHDMDIRHMIHFGCYFDYLEIHDGDNENSTQIGRFCGGQYSIPNSPIYSTHNYMYLKFVARWFNQNRGFNASYTTVDLKCGGIYKAPNGIIQMPKTTGTYENDEDCTWVIQAPIGQVVQLTWMSFNLERHINCANDYVMVFQNSSESDGTLSMGKYCGVTNPPTLVTQERTMTIIFHSDSSITREGFTASYVFLDASRVCGGHYYNSNGVIRTPNYPGNYPPNKECIWIIEVPNRQKVTLKPETFDLEGLSMCNFDYLEIRNGATASSPFFGKYCGSKIPNEIISFSNQLYLKFVSDSSLGKQGFSIQWESTTTGCGGELTGSSGEFASPSYPLSYQRGTDCVWKIIVSEGSIIQLIIIDFELENHFKCGFDYVEIFDGTDHQGKSLGRYCGRTHPTVINSTSNVMSVKFRSDYSQNARGFFMRYNIVCHNTLRGFYGIIESPNYPNVYPHLANCTWKIDAPTGNKVNITFFDLQLESSYDDNCTYDRVEIKEGEYDEPHREIGKYCRAEKIPRVITSTLHQVYINFVTDSFTAFNGFRLEWAVHGCSKHLNKPYGIITSPGYPNSYPENVDCHWLIEVDQFHSIEITFIDIDVEAVEDCYLDKIQLYNGGDETAPLIADFCHSERSITYTSTGNKMFMKFHSDFSYVGHGFKARYRTIDIQCGGRFTGQAGIIHSTNYPKNHPPKQHCEWLIQEDANHLVNLTFLDFDFENSRNCKNDYVKIFDGATTDAPVLGTHCGNQLPPSYISSSNEMLVLMESDKFISSKGFKASYAVACGARIVTDDQGVLTTSSTRGLLSNENCTWHIVAKNLGDHVTLTFTHMQLTTNEDNNECEYDSIKVFEGDTADGPLLGTWCGTKVPAPITSQGNALTLLFVPFDQLITNHFVASYSVLNTACGGNYTSEHGTISSPGYPNNYPKNAECVWILHTSPGNRISLNLNEFDLELSDNCEMDFLEVRENNGVGKILGLWCGSSHPSVVANTSLWIKFRSDEIGSNKGFVAEYSLLHGNELSGPTGQISSPMYPKPYTQNSDPSWRVTVENGYAIKINFLDLHLDQYLDTCEVELVIYDGYDSNAPELLRTCGLNLPDPVISISNLVYIKLYNNNFYRGSWFLLEWLQVPKASLTGDIARDKLSNCSEIISFSELSKKTYNFNSPGYPNGYARNSECNWIFESPPGTHLSLKFNYMDLDESYSCEDDYVAVYRDNGELSRNGEWSLINRYCLKNSTSFRIPGTNLMKVQFVSDAYINKTGFQASVREECGGVLTAPNGVIEIDNSTQNAGDNRWLLSCQWNVTVRPGKTIEITIEKISIDTAKSGVCGEYYLMLKNGGSETSPILGIGKYCGNTPPSPLQTTGHQLYVKLRGVRLTSRFKLTYKEVGIDCGERVIMSKGQSSYEISSPNYPNIPSPFSECFWTFLAPAGERLAIHFEDKFDLAYGASCGREYVEIRDGGTEISKLLGRFCGSTAPSSITSTRNSLYVHFYTDLPDPKNGFKAYVTTGGICGGLIRDAKGVISSPNYPNNYDTNNTCVWAIDRPNNQILKFNFRDLDLPFAGSCNDTDYVEIVEELPFNNSLNVIGQYCGTKKPDVIQSTSNHVMIRFKSDTRSTSFHKGFSLNFTSAYERCGGELTGMHGTFQTPGYPNRMSTHSYCHWMISAPEGYHIVVNVLDFKNIPNLLDQIDHKIMFYNDFTYKSRIGFISPRNTVRQISSSSNTMMIHYWSRNEIIQGFKAEYNVVAPAPCGGTMTDYEGTLSIPSEEVYNGTSLYCKWTLKAPNDTLESNKLQEKTLAIAVTGSIEPHVFASRMCQYRTSKVVLSDTKKPVAYICGNMTKPIRAQSPSLINTLTVVQNYYPNNRTAFNIKYKWHNCGGLLSGPSDSIEAPKNLTYPIECVWHAKYPDNGETINMSFERLNLGSCDNNYIVVRNGGPLSAEMRRICGSLSEFTNLTSQRNELWIQYYTTDATSDFKFRLEALSHGCGGSLRDRNRDLASPNYPHQYPNNAECIWEITADPGYHIGLVFIDRFYLEKSTDCANDYVQIFNWHINETTGLESWMNLGKECGRNPPPPFNSTSNRMKVVFRSNDAIKGDGFHARWNVNCGGVFEATSKVQYVTSPGYPYSYSSNLYCNYTIVAPEEIIVQFTDFQVEGYGNCRFDNVTIESNEIGSEKRTWCGTNRPSTQRGYSKIEIIFQTDSFVEYKGFEFKYHIMECGGKITKPGIISPWMEDNVYFGNLWCTWDISAPTGKTIVLRFEKFDLEYSSRCLYDYVTISEGFDKLLGTFCGNLTSNMPIVQSESNKMTVTFRSDYSRHYGGFSANIIFMDGPANGCGGLINVTDTYTFKTQNGSTYNSLLDCHWVVRGVFQKNLQFTVNSMDLKNATNGSAVIANEPCTGDFVEIRDGAGPLAELIGQYCGNVIPSPITSSTNVLFIRLFTDGTVEGRGLTATITITDSLCGNPLLILYDKTENITSPGYPNSYAPGVKCRWTLRQNNGNYYGSKTFEVHFYDFDMENTDSCSGDKLEISDSSTSLFVSEGFGEDFVYNGKKHHEINTMLSHYHPSSTYRYCGTAIPHDYYSNSRDIQITFTSAATQKSPHKGFKIAVGPASCNRNYTREQGRIHHNDFSECWITITAPVGYTISMYFNEFTLVDDMHCTESALQIRDGNFTDKLLATLCGNTIPNPIFSSGNKISLHSWSKNYYIFEHYDITYTTTDKGRGCGGKLFNYGGGFTSPLYPNIYRNNSVCTWEVSVPTGLKAVLNFEIFDLGSPGTCDTDFIEIFDVKADGELSLRETYCGGDHPARFTSDGNVVSVKYTTTVNNGGSWVITFMAKDTCEYLKNIFYRLSKTAAKLLVYFCCRTNGDGK